MEIRNSRTRNPHPAQHLSFSSFDFRISIFLLLLAAGCGAPGEPSPPTPPVPKAITDLAAQQAGDGVQLIFTLPSRSIRGEHLAELPAVEILRGTAKPDGSPDAQSFRVVDSIPAALLGNYLSQGRVQFVDPLLVEEIRAHPGEALIYRVRTRLSLKRASADSNSVSLRVFPVAERIASLNASVTESAIELTWQTPSHTSGGDALPAISTYHVYRGEIDAESADAAAKDIAQAKWKVPLQQLAASDSNAYKDGAFDFGKTYVYIVRPVIMAGDAALESNDSAPAIVAARDTFPPAAPQGLVTVLLPGEVHGTSQLDLTWSISLETDLAGYRVYRTEEHGTRGQLLTLELLPTPAYRDTSVVLGHRYWYSVTAVDRAGNESTPSAPAAVDVTQPSS
jgi:hypothetical protein